jgi:hypothetical protein
MYKDSIKCIPLSLEEESRMYRDSIKCIPLSLEKDSRMYKDSIKCLSSLSLGEGGVRFELRSSLGLFFIYFPRVPLRTCLDGIGDCYP